jgi:rubrerythrin
MTTPQATPIRSTEELFAHAIEIEREAAARYAELGERMRDLGNDVVAELFLRLADAERKHERELREKARGLALPHLEPGQYAWLEERGPETAAHDLVLHLLTPHGALQVALDAEKRALGFFESVRKTAANVQLSTLAGEMAAEEGVHVEWVKSALRRTPDPAVDWAAVFG